MVYLEDEGGLDKIAGKLRPCGWKHYFVWLFVYFFLQKSKY